MALTVFRIVVLWASVLLVAGCAGITPYNPPDTREEPPVNGLLTGEKGEFAIYIETDTTKSDSQNIKDSNKTSDNQ